MPDRQQHPEGRKYNQAERRLDGQFAVHVQPHKEGSNGVYRGVLFCNRILKTVNLKKYETRYFKHNFRFM